MSINVVEKIDGLVKVKHVLISVSDKNGLEDFIPNLLGINPEIKIFSTGGTYSRIKEILLKEFGEPEVINNLLQVSEYTGQPETQGGLVKTLDFKVYLGLLSEKYNDAHQDDLKRTNSVPIDMVIVNLYPFKETIARPNVTVEMARGNIDIGGPCMIRASAKNFIRVASVVDPIDYPWIISELKSTHGSLNLQSRYKLAQKAFNHTADYDRAIADFLGATGSKKVIDCYPEIVSGKGE